MWATVLGVARLFGVTEKYALYEISYQNALLYSRAVPMPGDRGNGDKPLYEDGKDACNVDNFTDFTKEEEVVRV